jgi:HSP20 family protein
MKHTQHANVADFYEWYTFYEANVTNYDFNNLNFIIMTLVSISRPRALSSVNNRNEYGKFLHGFANAVDKYARDCHDTPAVNIIEEPKQFRIQLAAPGFSKKDFSINVEKDQLMISAESEFDSNQEVSYILNEFSKCGFKRSFTMGKSIDTSRIEANYLEGILTVTLLKKEDAIEKPPRTISIS